MRGRKPVVLGDGETDHAGGDHATLPGHWATGCSQDGLGELDTSDLQPPGARAVMEAGDRLDARPLAERRRGPAQHGVGGIRHPDFFRVTVASSEPQGLRSTSCRPPDESAVAKPYR